MTPDQQGDPDPHAEPAVPPGWLTGTAIDEFTPMYVALARANRRHGALSPAEVDALDISVVAALLGVGDDSFTDSDIDAQAVDLARKRMAAAARGGSYTWDNQPTPSA